MKLQQKAVSSRPYRNPVALRAPKPFSLDAPEKKYKSVPFNTKKTGKGESSIHNARKILDGTNQLSSSTDVRVGKNRDTVTLRNNGHVAEDYIIPTWHQTKNMSHNSRESSKSKDGEAFVQLAQFLTTYKENGGNHEAQQENGQGNKSYSDAMLLEMGTFSMEATAEYEKIGALGTNEDSKCVEQTIVKTIHNRPSMINPVQKLIDLYNSTNCHALSKSNAKHDNSTDDDFVTPPLPPPPSDEDLLEVASYNSQSPNNVQYSTSGTSIKPVITPTFKATSTKFNAWSPKPDISVNGNSETDSTGVKLWRQTSKENAPSGFRSVTRPVSKKSEKSPATVSSSSTSSYSLPEGQHFPTASENVKVTPKNELPEGAVYETHTLDGSVIHTDTYYPAPGGEKMVYERTKKTTVIKAEHHQGMGPTNEEGIPVALRSSVENQKAWYKNMFKQIHKVETDEDSSSSTSVEEVNHAQPAVHSSFRPKRVGKITDYTPSTPYVVENKPKESKADYSSLRKNNPSVNGSSRNVVNGNSNSKKSLQPENKIPPASTSYQPPKREARPPSWKTEANEPVHGKEYSKTLDYNMADYVVTEPKKPSHVQPNKPKVTKAAAVMRKPAKVKFDFVAQNDRQLNLLKEQIVIVTREVNKDWYEGESHDGKHTGIFPVAYVKMIEQETKTVSKKGMAKAKFDFKGSSEKQLTVKKGDTVELLEKVDSNWYKGSLGGKSGILPANYLEVIREPVVSKEPSKISVNNQAPKTSIGHQSNNTSHSSSLSISSTGSDPDDKEKMGRASYLANAVVHGGVNLHHAKPRRGEFDIPELDDDAMGIEHEEKRHTVLDAPISHDRSPSNSSSLHSELSQNLHITPPAESPKPSSHPKDYPVETVPKQTEQLPQKIDLQEQCDDILPPMLKHVALYPYSPQNEDELELIGGDIVQVIEKCEDGWYVGTCERTGAFGTFPGNYVIAVD